MVVLQWLIIVVGALVALKMVLSFLKTRRKAKRSRESVPVMTIEGGFSHSVKPDSAYQSILRQIKWVEQRESGAVIVCVNSPGSSVGAAHEIYLRLRKLRENGMKVVVLMQDVAASGGVYVSMAADYIVASPGVITGSIGVIMQGYDFSQLLPFLKVGVRTIKSGAMKDILSSTRPMTDPEREVLDDMVGEALQQFRDVVAEGRKLSMEKVVEMSDGRVFSGRRAVAFGLADENGGIDAALQAAIRLAEMPEGTEPEWYEQPKKGLSARLREALPGARLEQRLHDAIPDASLDGIPLYMLP